MPIDFAEYGKDHAAEVLAEIVAAAEQPAADINDVYAHVDAMWQAADARGDEEAKAIISAAWEQMQSISNWNQHAVTIAAAARTVAETLKEQRDMAVEQFNGLERAVWTKDDEHPDVARLLEEAREEWESDLVNSGAYISQDPAMDTLELAEIPITHEMAEDLHLFLAGVLWQGDEIEEITYRELCDEFAHFASRFCDKLRRAMDYRDGLREEQRAQARREFMMALVGSREDE